MLMDSLAAKGNTKMYAVLDMLIFDYKLLPTGNQ